VFHHAPVVEVEYLLGPDVLEVQVLILYCSINGKKGDDVLVVFETQLTVEQVLKYGFVPQQESLNGCLVDRVNLNLILIIFVSNISIHGHGKSLIQGFKVFIEFLATVVQIYLFELSVVRFLDLVSARENVFDFV